MEKLMKHALLSFAVMCGLAAFSLADPVKKAPAYDADKLCKECGEAFIKALIDGKMEDALKMCATPFRDHDGTKMEDLDKLKKEFERPPPPGIEIKITDVVALDKFNALIKKKEGKELTEEQLKDYGEYMGKEGRVVLIEVSMMGQKMPREDQPHMLIRIKDGKAQIVGIGGR